MPELRNYSTSRRFESLEARNLMAGNVTAAVIEGNLWINGDAKGNSIEVRQTSKTDWEVVGIGTLINGRDKSFVVKNYDGLTRIALKGGNDAVKIADARIDSFFGIDTGAGSDFINLQNLRGDMNLLVQSGDGNDVIRLNNIRCPLNDGRLYVNAGIGNDTVTIDRVFGDSLGVQLGAGNDIAAISRITTSTEFYCDSWTGHDSISIVGVSTREFGLLTEESDGSAIQVKDVTAIHAGIIGGPEDIFVGHNIVVTGRYVFRGFKEVINSPGTVL
jgi:hypothetical protein